MKKKILMFADGASKGNPGPAGWGTILVLPHGQVIELGAGQCEATNNQMELQAVIAGLQYLQQNLGEVLILTDSSYVIQGAQQWLPRWQLQNWHTASGEPVRNQEQWRSLAALLAAAKMRGLLVRWQHVRGHAGIAGNERVDRIAHHFALGQALPLYQGDLADYAFDPYDLQAKSSQTSKAPAGQAQRKKQKAYSYLSMINGVLETHPSWAECEARVKGRPGAKFKKAISPEEEQAIIKDWQG